MLEVQSLAEHIPHEVVILYVGNTGSATHRPTARTGVNAERSEFGTFATVNSYTVSYFKSYLTPLNRTAGWLQTPDSL